MIPALVAIQHTRRMLLFQHHSPLPAWQHRIKYASTSTCAMNQTCKYQNVLNQLKFASPPTAVDSSVWSKSPFLVPVWGHFSPTVTSQYTQPTDPLPPPPEIHPVLPEPSEASNPTIYRGNGGQKTLHTKWGEAFAKEEIPLRLNDMTKKAMVIWSLSGVVAWDMRLKLHEYYKYNQIYISIPSEGSLAESRQTIQKAPCGIEKTKLLFHLNLTTVSTPSIAGLLKQLSMSYRIYNNLQHHTFLTGNLDLFTSSTPTFISMTQMVVNMPFSTERTPWVQKLELFSSQISYPSLHNSQ